MTVARTLAAIVGLAATLLAAAVALAPALASAPGPLGGLAADPAEPSARLRLVATSGALALGLLWIARGGSAADEELQAPDAFDAATHPPPEPASADGARLVGADLEARWARATAGDERALAAVRDRLRRTAVQAVARSRGQEREAAAAAIATGDWTDDRTAAAFLAERGGPGHGVRARLRLWLDPERERERRVRRTVAAVQSLAGGGG